MCLLLKANELLLQQNWFQYRRVVEIRKKTGLGACAFDLPSVPNCLKLSIAGALPKLSTITDQGGLECSRRHSHHAGSGALARSTLADCEQDQACLHLRKHFQAHIYGLKIYIADNSKADYLRIFDISDANINDSGPLSSTKATVITAAHTRHEGSFFRTRPKANMGFAALAIPIEVRAGDGLPSPRTKKSISPAKTIRNYQCGCPAHRQE